MNLLKSPDISLDSYPIGRYPARYIFCVVITLYHLLISPFLGPCCRFYPSCSVYAVEAVIKYGIGKGGWMALKRLLKCHPFHPGGVDLVP
jgi:putative membrane protein insertion efficiency factor